jgi:hypothetical protein
VTVAKQARLSDNQKKCESKKEKQISIPKKKDIVPKSYYTSTPSPGKRRALDY